MTAPILQMSELRHRKLNILIAGDAALNNLAMVTQKINLLGVTHWPAGPF